LGVDNVISAFRNCGLFIDEESARLIIKRYDDDRDGLLSFNNVRDIFSPRDQNLSN
jgi:Ca2+-binding EF-hand superfamily protein